VQLYKYTWHSYHTNTKRHRTRNSINEMWAKNYFDKLISLLFQSRPKKYQLARLLKNRHYISLIRFQRKKLHNYYFLAYTGFKTRTGAPERQSCHKLRFGMLIPDSRRLQVQPCRLHVCYLISSGKRTVANPVFH
jgi:hypothetical protein